MRSLVQSRNSEIDRLEKACVSALANSSANSDKFKLHSQRMSMLNAQIRVSCINSWVNFFTFFFYFYKTRFQQMHIDYSKRIEALFVQQRRKYRQLVRKLYENEEDDSLLNELTAAVSIAGDQQVLSSPCSGSPTTAHILNSISLDEESFRQRKQSAAKKKAIFKKQVLFLWIFFFSIFIFLFQFQIIFLWWKKFA